MERIGIEAISVCVGYGDLLHEVAPFNRPLLDRWVVVTTAADLATRRVCSEFSIECVLTEEMDRDGPFSKGRAVNLGLSHLSNSGWLLHLDSDIALPHDLHMILADVHMDDRCIYGCDRLNVIGAAAWERIKRGGLHSRRRGYLIETSRTDTEIGARIANTHHGYTPIGFFQLWHGSARAAYPIHHGTAARTDVQHALYWSRRQRIHIPELLVWHLESERSPMGLNWDGRKSRPFGTTPDTAHTGETPDDGSVGEY
jgi:hypothetical protein